MSGTAYTGLKLDSECCHTWLYSGTGWAKGEPSQAHGGFARFGEVQTWAELSCESAAVS